MKQIREMVEKYFLNLIRNKFSLTQDDLAKKADAKYSTLAKVESGVVNKLSVQTMALW
jgi:DNA-binding XRE family transcriptional regulator